MGDEILHKTVIFPQQNLFNTNFKKKKTKKTILFLNKISQICYKEKINYLLIESNIDFNTFQNIRNSIKRKNIFFLYDLGNRVNFYKNVFLDILKFGNNIKQIHIKDKDSYN